MFQDSIFQCFFFLLSDWLGDWCPHLSLDVHKGNNFWMASTPPCDSAGTGEAGGSAAEDELTALVSIGVEWTTDDPTEAPPEAVVDGYTVVDADGMPRSLIDGSLESGVALYLSGTVRRCDRDADTGAATAAAAKAAEETARVWLAGPIHQWWMCGFSGDQEHMLVGVSTELCCYYMDKPSAEYYETALPLLQAAQLGLFLLAPSSRKLCLLCDCCDGLVGQQSG